MTGTTSEATTERSLKFGSETVVFGGASGTTFDFTVSDSFTNLSTKVAGVTADLKLTVTDSVGNTGAVTVTGVTIDQIAPTISNLFPSTAALPDDKTINNATKTVRFQIDEKADSISIRYVQVGSSPPDLVTQSVSTSKLGIVATDIDQSIVDTLIDNESYSLQLFARDLAQNVTITAPDTLKFDKDFNNPLADSFVVASVTGDSVLAGQAVQFTVTAIDSKLTRTSGSNRKAVTYSSPGVLVRVAAGDQDVSGVTFWGTGVTNNAGEGSANLDGDTWQVGTGTRTVYVNSTGNLQDFAIVVEDTTTKVLDGVETVDVIFDGNLGSLDVVSADMRKFWVQAWETAAAEPAAAKQASDLVLTDSVQGTFWISVTPTDLWGNPSTKVFEGAQSLGSDSLNLRESRLTGANSANWLEEVAVTISANDGRALTPSGPQTVATGDDGTMFALAAPRNGSGDNLVVTVRMADAPGDSSTLNNQDKAYGSVALSFVAVGEDFTPDTPGDDGAPDAPANLLVQDRGGDQGGFVMVSFPNSTSDNVSRYRLYRQIMVNSDLVDGEVVALEEAVAKWVSWTTIDAVPVLDGDDAITRAVVPTLGGAMTAWSIAAESGGESSERVASKRVFTKESVQLMAQFLGVDPNRVLSAEELNQVFTPSKDYVKSILGDQKNLVFAALDPDLADLMNTGTVPQNIRTQGGQILSSGRTESDPARSIDNIPPAAVTEAEASAEDGLSWTVSADDRVVAFSTYRGYSIPIPGVRKYEVMRGDSEETLEAIELLPPGTDGYTDPDIPSGSVVYRIDALDLDNRTIGELIELGDVVDDGRIEFATADGKKIFIIATDDATPFEVDFSDFIAFAGSFGSSTGDAAFLVQADTDDNGTIEFADFIAFAGSFGLTAASQNGQPIPSTKPLPVPQNPGLNENTELSLRMGSSQVLVGQAVTVDVSLANASALQGFGFELLYDTDKFEFVGVAPAEEDLMKSAGGETPLFLHQLENPGHLTVGNALINSEAVSGGGDVVQITFKVLREFEDNARFEIANGIVFDPDQLSNPVVTGGILEVQSTPTEFALFQNFPNPFNPETTIRYNLSDASDVRLQIYNVVGQVVRTLVAERQSAGRYQIQWNGMDDRGVAVSSGIYFYQIAASGNFQDVRKLMLLK